MTTDKAAAFWDNEVVEQTHIAWMAHPLIRAYINESISGDTRWPLEWFAAQRSGRVFERVLSIGCGTGAFERSLASLDLARSIDAFDASSASITIARQEAAAAGLTDRINYSIGDFNEPRLPRAAYDAVFFHQSLHHVAKLEKLFRALMRALRPGGIVYMDEYVGPSRLDWTNDVIRPHLSVYRSIPRELRTGDDIPMPIQVDDPSEAIRSNEIVPLLQVGFTIVDRRDYGGTYLAVLYPHLATVDDEWVRYLIDEERSAIRAGAEAYYTVVIAEPRRGIRAGLASGYYFWMPKLRRLRLEILRVIRPGHPTRF